MGFWQILAATSLTSSECRVAENMSTCTPTSTHVLIASQPEEQVRAPLPTGNMTHEQSQGPFALGKCLVDVM